MLGFFITAIIIIIVCYLKKELKKEDDKRENRFPIILDTTFSKTTKEKYSNLTAEEIVLNNEINDGEKRLFLEENHGYSFEEAQELIETAKKEKEKAKLAGIKRKITKKAQELYDCIPSDDNREPIPDKVRLYVWQRDGGKCAKCGSQKNLEFDHIIPFSKGGSNTERNIQLLCEECNRAKSNKI